MQHERKTDVADRFRHGVAHALPALARAVEAVHPAVVLLVQAVGREGMQPHAVHVVAVLRVLDGKEIGGDALVERPPGLSAIRALERSADRDADVEMPGVARIDVDRVQGRAARRPLLLLAADPDDAHGVGIEAGDAFPSDTAVIGAEQSRRRDACVPGAGLRRMPRCKPEDMFDRQSLLAGSGLGERGWALGFLPRVAEVGRAASCRRGGRARDG